MKANNNAQIASIEKESVFGIVPILTREKQYRFSDAFFFLASYGIATWNYTQGAYIATLCSFKQLMITTMVGSLLVMLIFELPAILSTRYGIDIWIWMKAVLGHTGVKIVTIMVACIVISFFGSRILEDFTELTYLGAVICFGYTSASTWKLAKENGNRMYVITGVIGAVASAVFAIVKLVPWLPSVDPMGANAFLLLTVWCLLGFMFYLRTLARSSAGVYSGTSLSGIMMFALLLYSVLMWLG